MGASLNEISEVSENYEASIVNKYSGIRILQVSKGDGAPFKPAAPLKSIPFISIPWFIASDTTATNGIHTFSAVCYIFGRNVYDKLNGTVPIGLIQAAVGGTSIVAWVPPTQSLFNACGLKYDSEGLGGAWPVGYNGCLYDRMIAPFTVGPLALTGITWYQGESDAYEGAGAEHYGCMIKSLINEWRSAFKAPQAYFGFIQISTWCVKGSLDIIVASIREQQMVALDLPKVGYATNADQGSGCDIHPKNKHICAARLAQSAMAIEYNQNVIWRSPTYKSSRVIWPGTVEISLNDVPPGGLRVKTPQNIYETDCHEVNCQWASLQYNDNSWGNATVSVSADGMKLIFTAQYTPRPSQTVVATQYGFSIMPMLSAYLKDYDLPVLPFSPQMVGAGSYVTLKPPSAFVAPINNDIPLTTVIGLIVLVAIIGFVIFKAHKRFCARFKTVSRI
jgi:hypothetical protein